MKNRFVLGFFGLFLIICFSNNARSGDERHPIMKPDMDTFLEWVEDYENAPRAFIDEKLMKKISLTGSYSVLSHIDYLPNERNQGVCGDCWVWTGTGILEAAYSVQEGVKDRLSIQYLNSCYLTEDYACCGGNLTKFGNFHNTEGQLIPWSNTNASFQDASVRCDDGSSSVSCGSISTSPSYNVSSISAVTIETRGVGASTAIANIKNVLLQNKAIYFSYLLPNDADWDVFYDFWDNDNESDIFIFDYSCGHTRVEGESGSHAVLVVGYNDDDPNNSYWIVLNSWGTEAGRPNGLFRVDMNIDYDCYYYHPVKDTNYYSLRFQTLDVEFAGGGSSTTTTIGDDVIINDYMMTKDPKKGTGCEIPTPATTFYSDDERVYCWFYWDYAYEKDELECNWYDPDGELYELDSSEATYTKGCWYPSIYISEYYPASAPGQWRVDVYMKGIKRFTEYFTIVSENTTTTTVSTSSTTTTISPTTTTIKPTTTTVKSTTTTTTPCSLNFIYGKDSQGTELLRYLRDEVLSQTPVGQEIIKLYYQWSPAIVNAMEENEKLKKEVKEMIDGVLPLIEGNIE